MHHVLLVALTGKRDRLTAASQQDRTYVLGSMGGGGGGGGGGGWIFFTIFVVYTCEVIKVSAIINIES